MIFLRWGFEISKDTAISIRELHSGKAAAGGIYFDNNATTRPLDDVVAAMIDVLGANFGNASSAHSRGETARQKIAQAREAVANLIDADPTRIFFTSSGTEANNLALRSGLGGGNREAGLLTSSVEHSSVIKYAENAEKNGLPVIFLKTTPDGRLDPELIARAIEETKPGLVSIQWVNSETGVIQSIGEISKICKDHGVLLHTDAAQAVGKIPIAIDAIDPDFLTFTAHKFHGPPGVGVLYAKNPRGLLPHFYGGDQESGIRPGTENLAGIVGAGVAAHRRKESMGSVIKKIERTRDYFESELLGRFEAIRINGDVRNRVCNTSNLLFDGLDGQALVAQLDAFGIYCSQSSACTNRRPEPSHVLRAMGLSEKEAYASVRFSFSEENSENEIDQSIEILTSIISRLSRILTASG